MDYPKTSTNIELSLSQPQQRIASPLFPELLVIDADEARTQKVSRLLTLADYHTLITANPYLAFSRYLQESFRPQAILLGQPDIQRHPIFKRLVSRLQRNMRYEVPVMTLPTQVPDETLLYTRSSQRSQHTISKSGSAFLETLCRFLPSTQKSIKSQGTSLVMDKLPAIGLLPRVSQEARSRNSHFRLVLKAAHNLLGEERWRMLLTDVGLAQFCLVRDWPPDNDQCAIPADYLSYLNQMVAFSRKDDPASQLHLWSNMATDISLQEHSPSFITQQALKALSQERLMSITLNAFISEMNAVRGEDLHFWRQCSNGSYWVIHYSNLYAYGRVSASPSPACYVWVASLQRTLHLVHLDKTWEIFEKECSCQTLTGHCLFVIRRRQP